MREILFRGKNYNGDWVYGYLNQHRGGRIFDCCCNSIDSEDYYINDWVEKIDTDLYGVFYKVLPETIGQFTGLTDKNDVEIFEGDIVSLVKYGNLTFTVVYDHCRYELFKANETSCFVLSIYKSEDIEVIGNIHDNPELLGSASQSDSADIAQDVLKPATPQNLSLCRDKNLDTT